MKVIAQEIKGVTHSSQSHLLFLAVLKIYIPKGLLNLTDFLPVHWFSL